MFSLNTDSEAPTNDQIKEQMEDMGFAQHAIGLNDSERVGIETLFPDVTGWHSNMLLKPGFVVANTGIEQDSFEPEIDAILAGG